MLAWQYLENKVLLSKVSLMSDLNIGHDKALYAGLRELAESNFPKRCRHCGKEYLNVTDFLVATKSLREDSSGLKQSLDDDGQVIVDVFRNCVCGSTMLESFYNRRDLSEQSVKRRKIFQDMVNKVVVEKNCSIEDARAALLKFMRRSISK